MNGLTRRAADRADGKGLGRLLGNAVVASRDALLDDLYVAVEARSATLDQRHIGEQAHLVDVPPCIQVIQRVEDNIETAEPLQIELRVFDVCVVGRDVDRRIEFEGCLSGHL